MNKVQSKHYSLLFQEDADLNEDILSIHNANISDEDDEDDDGFKSMIGEDEDPELEVEDEDEDIQEDDCSDEEIFSSSNQHRSLSNDGLRTGPQTNFGRKNDYHLLKNNEIDKKPLSLAFEPPLGTVWMPTPMSPVRRAFFLASIMFGVLVVAMFLWALPCDVQPCDNDIKLGPQQWFSEIDNVGVNYTKLLEKINGDLSLLVSFYTVEKFQDTINIKNISEVNAATTKMDLLPKDCGLLRLAENTGKESWRIGLDECPKHINCDLMDSTGDGLFDCLILGHQSMALMFEPIYGNIFWNIHVHGKDNGTGALLPSDYHFDMPITMPDLNADGFIDLLFPVYGLTSNDQERERKSNLVLVSGRTGAVIGKPFNILNCNKILQIFREDVSIGYSCSMENRSELVGKIPFTNLLNEIGHVFDHDKFQNETSKITPETNEAVCQIKYINKGKCPYCKTRIQLGLASDNPLHKDFEYSTVVSWKILSFANVCKGALLKLWKWDVSSLQEAFIENTPTKSVESSTKIVPNEEMAFNLENFDETHLEDSYKNIFSDPNANYKEESNFNTDYDTKKSYIKQNRRDAEQTYDYVTHRLNSKQSSVWDPKISDKIISKRFYEHPTVHQRMSQSTLGSLENKEDNSFSTTASSSLDNFNFGTESLSHEQTLPPSTILPPEGYRLQKLEEVMVLVLFNGTDWLSRDLGSMVVYQLCQKQCIPSHLSQKETVQIDLKNLLSPRWNVYVSSSTFSSYRKDSTNNTATWSLESYVRKLLSEVESKKDIL